MLGPARAEAHRKSHAVKSAPQNQPQSPVYPETHCPPVRGLLETSPDKTVGLFQNNKATDGVEDPSLAVIKHKEVGGRGSSIVTVRWVEVKSVIEAVCVFFGVVVKKAKLNADKAKQINSA